MKQNTNEWLAWRKKGLGASDAPIILGVSPWKTPMQLYEEKIDKTIKLYESNWAMERGNRLELVVRARYEFLNDVEMPAMNCEHSEIKYMRTSLDGGNKLLKRGIEIKVGGLADHIALKESNKIPEKYYPQLQHQFFVTGFEQIDYVSYYLKKGQDENEGDLFSVPVYPDLNFLKDYLPKAEKFWECVQKRKPPELIDKDFKIIKLKKVSALSEEYKTNLAIFNGAKKALDIVKKDLLNIVCKEHKRIKTSCLNIQLINRQGSVDYSKIPELKEVNLDEYRKKSSQYWKIDIQK